MLRFVKFPPSFRKRKKVEWCKKKLAGRQTDLRKIAPGTMVQATTGTAISTVTLS